MLQRFLPQDDGIKAIDTDSAFHCCSIAFNSYLTSDADIGQRIEFCRAL